MNGSARPVLDVSELPTIGFGTRAPLWWGQFWMLSIESTIFLLLFASYFYVRLGFSAWPPPGIQAPNLFWPTVNLGLLLLSCIPMQQASKAAKRRDSKRAALLLGLAIVMCFGILGIRWQELLQFNFKWSTDIYGSFVWCLAGLHTMHMIADTMQSCVLLWIVLSGRMGEKQILGIEVDGLYWYFVVAVWVPVYLLIYIYPQVLRG